MNVTELKKAIWLCREAQITPFVWGKHGIGKSASFLQECMARMVGMIDLRCSQIEASDLRGLPDREISSEGVGRTVYLPPADLPQIHKCSPACSLWREGRKKHEICEKGSKELDREPGCMGVLFLDELNRAEDDVLQAAFQLVWDKRIGTYELPKGWSVAVAGNYTEGYTVNSFNDAAFLNRFCHLDLATGDAYRQDWGDYMVTRGDHATINKILQFVSANEQHLSGKMEADRGFSVQPSPRSWEMVARVMTFANKYDKIVVKEVISGLIGTDLALAFEQFSVAILPSEIMAGFGKDMEKRCTALNRNELAGLVWGTASYGKELGKHDKDKDKMTNILEFMGWLAGHKDRDLAVMLGTQLISSESQGLAGAMLSNTNLAKLAGQFGLKSGRKISWIKLINDRPQLQEIMSRVAWGT